MRNFDLKAEAEMRLHSDRLAEELARERSERTATAADDSQGPGPADGPPTAGTADGAADDNDR
ncbi:hypothetical protein ACFVJH_35595 [Streptomyces decoyicus]|uniref:hypothetical protein n=1 Tax=Streptomyces decoyicus TaxID=249567 RepID=UPI003626843D